MKTSSEAVKPIILITGATSGIGRATAIRLAREEYRLILVARRAEALKLLGTLIQTRYHTECFTYPLDVRKLPDIERFMTSLPEEWRSISILVNNAGLAAGLDPIHEGSIGDWDQMIDTNIKGLLYMTRLITPGLVERQQGHIINVGSIAGKEVYPKGAVYCATKAAVDALTKGMRQDLVPYGIKVSSVCPGAVETEFSLVRFKGDEERAGKVYEGFQPLQAEDIASVIDYIISRPAHVNIQDVLVMPAAQASATIIHRK